MKTLSFILLVLVLRAAPAIASPAEEAAELKTTTGTLHGTLLIPDSRRPMPVVLLIAGSGPTDRDGNTLVLPGKNNGLKMLARVWLQRESHRSDSTNAASPKANRRERQRKIFASTHTSTTPQLGPGN